MPKTLNPVNTFPTSIPNFPMAGNNEPVAIGPLEAAIQAVLDRTENLHQSRLTVEGAGVKRVQRVASLSALQNLAGMSDGDTVDVEGYGRYRLYNPSALTADGLWVLTATGGGRWVHTLRDMRGAGNGLATLDSSQRLAQDVRDASILTQHIANQAVTSAKLAPGSVVGHLGYTPLNKAGDTMLGVLTIQANFSQLLNLKGGTANHVYMAFYARSADQNARSGYIGYPASGSNRLTIANEIGEIVEINNTLLSRYDHQNRFVVQKYIDSITVPANGSIPIAYNTISIPSGKALYLRRVRWTLGSLIPRVSATNTWTGSANFGDVTMDTLLGNNSLTSVTLSVVNNTSYSGAINSPYGIWAELEIR